MPNIFELFNAKNVRYIYEEDKNTKEEIKCQHNCNSCKKAHNAYDEWDNELFYGKLKEWGIPVGRKLSDMSRGEYLKFQLALSMGHNATLYILDEATAGMDPVFRREFFNILHELMVNEDITILMSTHIEEEIEVHMDYKVLLDGGRLISCDEVEV